jgi:polar amino acid transport system substrate-binding protein
MKLCKVLSNVFTSLLLLVTVHSAQAGQLESIQKRGVLKVAVPQDFPPFGSIGADFQPQGYDIDMAAYLAKELNVKLELTPVTSANRIPYLQTGKVDLIISSLGKNPARAKAIDFSAPYAPFFLGVFGTEDEVVASTQDLNNKTVGVTRGSVEDIELSKIVPSTTIIKRYEDNNATLSAFLSSQVSLIATGNLVVAEIASRFPEKAPKAKILLKNSPCYIGVMKDDAIFLTEINRLVAKAKQDGVLEGFSQKWLKAPFPTDLDA